MAKPCFLLFLGISLIFMLSMSLASGAEDEDRKVYIAYMGSLPEGEYFTSSQHLSMLQAVIKQSTVANYLIRSYKRSFNGFAAKLTKEEAKKLASMKEVISVFPSELYQLQTTRSWDFMGFSQTVKRQPSVESDIIIGCIDSGVWPESESFNDKGFGPPPKKWKGSCSGGKNFTCNNKLIGAKLYNKAFRTWDSVRDTEGHGTHTASTAAGSVVEDVSFFGLAKGTARGAVPSARIAAYRVCGQKGCTSEDIMAAFDDAIADGVDLITISIGGVSVFDLYQDVISIGAFHAAEKGILTVQSAGNAGPMLTTVISVAPWKLTVAASSTDRLFIDKVVLGNGKTLNGFSIHPFSSNGTKFPLAYGKQVVADRCDESSARSCEMDCLDSRLVKNKIVLCDAFEGHVEAYRAGASGTVMQTQFDNVSSVVPFPASGLNSATYISILSYINSTKNPVVEILKSETIKDSTAPIVATFSSRGPNYIVPDILKPDISAPGVDILAAYSQVASPSRDDTDDPRRVKYNVISGTSMACPHVAGVAAYVKSFHPDWSPSAIKSAIMTTAFPMSPSNNPDGEFAYGSGHVNPLKAVDPGLVYDAVKVDYINFLCSVGYSVDIIRQISGDNSTCPDSAKNGQPGDLNYPSLTAKVEAGKSFTVSFHRTVTNVGEPRSTYKVEVASNPELDVKVIPEVLSFKSLKEKKSYNVTVTGKALNETSKLSTSLLWSDGTHSVRSPIVIHTYPSISRNVTIA